MKIKHTKGEWVISESDHYSIDIDTGGIKGAISIWTDKIDPNEEELANARLVESASKLLDAAILHAYLYPNQGWVNLVEEATGQTWSRADLGAYVSEYIGDVMNEIESAKINKK